MVKAHAAPYRTRSDPRPLRPVRDFRSEHEQVWQQFGLQNLWRNLDPRAALSNADDRWRICCVDGDSLFQHWRRV